MSDENRVQRLLRLADPGPEIPAGGEARIRAAVRPVWKKEVRRRSALRVIWSAGIAAAAAAALFFVPVLFRTPDVPPVPIPVARVEIVRGPADATLQQRVIVAGSRVHTLPGGRAALRVAQGSSLRLDSDTTVRLLSAHVVDLEKGAIYIDSGGMKTQPMEVRTPFGIVRDIGTRFEVRVEKELSVQVREGIVDVATNKRQFKVGAGFQSTIDANGSQQMSEAAAGPEWTAGVAPPFPIEGRSVAALLEWCSRESGLAIRYANRDAEHLALTTLLHGSPNDLEPVEAAQLILPTAGLQAVRGKGELIVQVR